MRKGHACHFRCHGGASDQLRLDVLGTMRGVAPFAQLWERRAQLNVPGAGRLAVLALPDLVRSKKTQRDKDWVMIRRLVEADIAAHGRDAGQDRLAFWMRECRSPSLLVRLATQHPSLARKIARDRPLLAYARADDTPRLERLLRKEETREREKDQRYWSPLRGELEAMRIGRPRRRLARRHIRT